MLGWLIAAFLLGVFAGIFTLIAWAADHEDESDG